MKKNKKTIAIISILSGIIAVITGLKVYERSVWNAIIRDLNHK